MVDTDIAVSFDISQREKYAVQFTEDGTPVREEVSVDADSGTEVFRVPGHNNKEAMDVMNDFVAVSL